jgi:Arc/MetJ-type ribon-helix-helix transcriptional regulator
MTAAKIAITIPEEQLAQVRLAVRDGRAESVSAYIAKALAQQGRETSLRALVEDLVREHGEPTRKDKAWARRVLRRRRKA